MGWLHDAGHADRHHNSKLQEASHLIKASSGSKGFGNQTGELLGSVDQICWKSKTYKV